MHFKQIEIVGFKSFADRTVVNLEDGMTAVVGPNGCGKSNILDAMRWALGEQSAKNLRGAHMQDVIFNGSDERAPMGMAEVTLTFDNSDSALPVDFSEVQISRRVYRSGESEYLINKAPCRLRDIQELFMDTGVGTNAYSMIGQGKVAMVLSSKPDDRRYLFEEAAGIIKYKSRKRVAMRKLDQAEQNHQRLCDIIAELERQMRSLKRQVNAAIRYREMSAELKDLEIRASFRKHQELSAAIAELRETYATSQQSFEQASAEMSSHEARQEELNLAKLEADRDLHERRERVHAIDGEMEKIERDIALIRQQIDFSREQQAQAETEREVFSKQAETLAVQRETTLEKLAGLREEQTALNEQLSGKQSEHETAIEHLTRADALLESTRAQKVESMGIRAQTQNTLERINTNVDNIEAQLEAVYEQQEEATARTQQLSEELQSLHARETEHTAALGKFDDELSDLIRRHDELSSTIAAVNDAHQKLREDYSRTGARLHSLRELRDSYEGFASGVRAVMQTDEGDHVWSSDIVGPIGDLLSTQPDYERAIEAALGGSINNIVVRRADAAREAIAFLNETQAGRVTFLPLDTVKPNPNDRAQNVLNQQGVIGRAIENVTFDESVRNAVAYLLSDTLLVDTLNNALAIAKSGSGYPRLVTLSGEVVSAAGAVTGGRTQHDSRGLLGRSAEIEELEQRVAELEAALEAKANELESTTEKRVEIETARRETEARADAERTELSTVGMASAGLAAELESVRSAIKNFSDERDVLITKRTTFESERNEMLQMATGMDAEDETLQRAIAEAQDDAALARQELNASANTLSDLRVQAANVAKNVEQFEQEQQRLDRERNQALGEIDRRNAMIADFESGRERLDADTTDRIERSKGLSENKETARKDVVTAENARQALLDESETLEAALKTVREQVREFQGTVHQCELELRRNEDQLAFFQERILSEYNIALSSLKPEDVGEDEHDDETRSTMVAELRRKLERMGNVNLMAIEEYEALTERFNFLAAQEEDLRLAREALLGVISRIDSTIRDMFLETFKAVADQFRQNFRRLFNGGQARIYLLDEDDPLECGIEIEARPPGKKPQSISLLSGGEQAMTAIALLFGIFKAKPSPFCVLDEVDAPLDDANIGRFLSMVEEFAETTQFIVITHSKQTMARAGVLYGVTMQERGVSTLVSVKLDEIAESAEPAA